MHAAEDDRAVELIYDALDEGRALEALARARRTLAEGEDPVIRFLAGVALLDLGRAREATLELEAAVRGDEADPEFRAKLALAYFRSLNMDEAEREARAALELDPRTAEAEVVIGLVDERRGSFDDAESRFERAHRLDPEGFPRPFRVAQDHFDEEVEAAAARLPERFREPLKQVAVSVDALPSDALLLEEDPPLDPELLGLFVGVALPEVGVTGGGGLPPRIHLFQRNLERFAIDREELLEEIAVTLYHELGHYLGLDEEELEELDLA